MPRISKAHPAGFVYVLQTKYNADRDVASHTKIGCSSKAFYEEGGRAKIAEFWINALGVEIVHWELPHVNAYMLEKMVHSGLSRSIECGTSTESFDITFADAVKRVEAFASKVK